MKLGLLGDMVSLCVIVQLGKRVIMEPTKEQIQWLWEQCGFTRLPYGNREYHFELTKKVMNWLPPDKRGNSMEYLPRIDLNNLFKYAVPKLQDLRWVKFNFDSECELRIGNRGIFGVNDDPALALFWAIFKALGGK